MYGRGLVINGVMSQNKQTQNLWRLREDISETIAKNAAMYKMIFRY